MTDYTAKINENFQREIDTIAKIDRGEIKKGVNHSAILNLHLNKRLTHTAVLADIAHLNSVTRVYEI